MPFTIDHPSATAEKFLDALSPRGPVFGDWPFYPSGWVFRGHSNDQEYKLIPTALREKKNPNEPVYGKWVGANNYNQVRAELECIIEFFKCADSNGLPLPEDSQQLRNVLIRTEGSLLVQQKTMFQHPWPPDELLSLIGLAQHHGLPTRLLDWTQNARTAAYFAAKGAAKRIASSSSECRPCEYISVWALDTNPHESLRKRALYNPSGLPFLVVSAPASQNPNLRAQEGLFTLIRQDPAGIDPKGAVDRSPMDEFLKKNYHRVDGKSQENPDSLPMFYHFTVPASESRKMLRLLAIDGISAASLFPGFGGVKEALMERRLWDAPLIRPE